MTNRSVMWAAMYLGLAVAAAGAEPLRLYVAVDGQDAWSGRMARPSADGQDGPFATLDRARDAIRVMRQAGSLPAGGVDVVIGPGDYQRYRAFELSAQDGGTAQSPIVYRATAAGQARLLGGREVTGFRPVTDRAILDRLEPSARGNVLEVDLRAQGIDDFGSPRGGGLELFFREKPMRIARWPNEGFVTIARVLGATEQDIRGTKGTMEAIFSYEGDRPSRWAGAKDVWLHGYWFWDWADQRQKVQSIDTQRRVIQLEKPYHSYGYRQGQWYYTFNVLAELDQPGEWYLDRQTGVLYFWPPEPIEQGQVLVSVLPTLVCTQDVSFVTFAGLTLEAMRDTAVVVRGGSHVRLDGCTIRNGGASAASLTGTQHTVSDCQIYQMGEGGISLAGGDRVTLTPAGLLAENNHIHHYGRWKPMYSAGISVSGVGNRLAHNLIHSAPHQAISFGGNDHTIELNEIHDVCFESNDAGAIYSGRDWTMRGTVIRHNYLHHIQGYQARGCVGVYLDDMYCGTEISGNIFYQVTRAAFIGGGRDCLIQNNLFVDCDPAVHVDARALGWAHDHSDQWIEEGRTKGTLSGIAFRQPPYSLRYPQLAAMLDDEPAAPKGNRVVRNICFGGRWDEVESVARPLVEFQDNLLDTDPLLVDVAKLDFRLQVDSPAWKLGFERIPVEQIGLQPRVRAAPTR